MNLIKKNEKGFLSGFVMLFVVTLALMGVGGALLMNSEGTGVGTTHEAIQANYTVDSAMWLTLVALDEGVGDEMMGKVPFTIGSATVTQIDTIVNVDGTITLNITAKTSKTIRKVQAILRANPGLLAITTTGNVDGVDVTDENGQDAPELIDENNDELPEVEDAYLEYMANDQGYYHNGNYTPPDGYPNGRFYNANGSPNVTYINGNLNVALGDEVYGIFIVTGDVNIAKYAEVHGVIYTPNSSSSVELNGPAWQNSIEGGIMSASDVDGAYGLFNRDSNLKYNPEFVKGFMECGGIDLPDRHETSSYTYNPD